LPDRTVSVRCGDLVFRARLEAVVRSSGATPVPADVSAELVVVELINDDRVQVCADLVSRGARVLAFGPHVEARRLRAARAAGATVVTNAEVHARLGQMLAAS
jgi:hypothetical protein